MNITKNNPFRTLGVYSNASTKEIAANKAKLAAYLKVGKNVEFPIDKLTTEPVERTAESVEKAVSDINLPADRLQYAMFWFIKASPIDEIALNHLAAGNSEKATELFGKKETFSSLQNTSTLALYNEDYDTAIATATKLIHEDEFRTAFVQAVCGETFLIEEDEMAHLFIDTLCEELPNEDWRQIFKDSGQSSDDDEYLNAKAVGEPLTQIENAIATAKSVDGDDAEASLNAGTTLMKSTKKPLAELKKILGKKDMQYQMIADKLANRILQCGINYYNNADDDDSPLKAMKLQKYATTIAVGQMAKDRCKQNVEILQKTINRLPPKEVISEVQSINAEQKEFCNLPDEICYAEKLLRNTQPYLQSIKTKLGDTNDFYLKISTQVVGNALHNVIEEVNNVQKEDTIEINGQQITIPLSFASIRKVDIIKSTLRAAWKTTLLMDEFDMESDFKTNRYNQNRNTLKGLCEQLGISTTPQPKPKPKPQPRPQLRPEPRPEPRPQTPTPSTPSDSDSGCIIFVVAAIILMITIIVYMYN